MAPTGSEERDKGRNNRSSSCVVDTTSLLAVCRVTGDGFWILLISGKSPGMDRLRHAPV
jgi:hypothetical protein